MIKFGRKGGPPGTAPPPQKGTGGSKPSAGKRSIISNLPPRYSRILITQREIDVINSGGAEGINTL